MRATTGVIVLLGVWVGVWAMAAAAAETAWPAGWSAFPADSRPPVTFLDGGKTVEVRGGRQGGTRSLSLALARPADRVEIEFSFAFSASRGRSMNLWTRPPQGTDANLVNLAIQHGVLQQYAKGDRWQDVTDKLAPTRDWARPVWHRMRIRAGRKHAGVTYFVSAPGRDELPKRPTATRPGYRPGLAFGSVDLAFGRLARGAKFRIRGLTVRLDGVAGAPESPPQDERFVLWDPKQPVPTSAQLHSLKGVRFAVVKRREPEIDGYNWLHGAAAVFWGKRLCVSFGHNKGAENTAGEIAQCRWSDDGGRTWGPVQLMGRGAPGQAVSHGVFVAAGERLWAFHGAFTGRMQDVHTNAYVWDAKGGAWRAKGVVARQGFWPMDVPKRLSDGGWIMAGVSVAKGYGGTDRAAVARCDGRDLTKWRVVVIDREQAIGAMWGESTVIVRGRRVVCIARWQRPWALAAVSENGGRTWSTMVRSNLPMAASKPLAGVLSTGQAFLIGTTTSDGGNRRSPLTIAVSRPGENVFRRIYRIRDAVHSGPGESGRTVRLAYPYAVEHDGKLWVVYSNDGGRGGNRNSAEMAVIPVASLTAE